MEPPGALTVVFLVALLGFATRIIYLRFWHPLAKFPGPTLSAISSIPISIAQLTGRLHQYTEAAHARYGAVVRLAPYELSFASAGSWNDIYGRRQGKPPLPRDSVFFNEMLVDRKTLTMADDQTHARIRRAMNPAFSTRALSAQEPILQRNVNLLLSKLQDFAQQGQAVDLRAWYNYTTFDLIGDLAFGETFGCLATNTYHEWVHFVISYFFASSLLQVIHRFRPLNRILAALMPQELHRQKQRHGELTQEKTRRRIKAGTEQADFVEPMIQASQSGQLSVEEIEQQASILILAGSETTATALTVTTYLLVENPRVLAELRRELHAHYSNESQIDILSVHQLQYLHAVLQEALRLFPPITNGFPRETPAEGAIIDGHYVPKGVTVNINHWSVYRSPANFTRPNEFIPERWMGAAEFETDVRDVFQPFSVGPRSCIGKKFAYDSMKLILARSFWRFDMSLAPASRNWLHDQKTYVSFHQPPLMVNLEMRRGTS
ncbi:hypothetical protein AbraIFM66950_008204 [Aspergillus brasiliensis]|nr:hypothetical protein AbraIFM66950_008204 [Aspergillus brasiliensis]